MVDSQSNSNNDMVNLYNSRLKAFNITEIINDAHAKLVQWRDDCHKTIDDLYEQKSRELKSYIDETTNKYEEKKKSVQTLMAQLDDQQKVNEENKDLVKFVIHSIEQGLNDIEQTFIKIHIRPLTIDNNYVHIEKKFNFPNFSSDHQTFFYSEESSSAMASNQQVLLVHQNPYLCLIDRDSKIVKQYFWKYDWIRDMCWSSTLSRFIIITTNNIYSIDEKLHSCSLMNEQTQEVWFSCTCSNLSLYLSTCEWGSSIYELNLSPSYNLVHHWKPPLTCGIYEGINDIKYNNETLALMIRDSKENKKRMDLKSAKTFDTIWSRQLSVGSNMRLFTCCPLNYNEWLVIDGTNLQMYYLTKDGKFNRDLSYHSVPYRANLFASNILAVSAECDLNLHKILI